MTAQRNSSSGSAGAEAARRPVPEVALGAAELVALLDAAVDAVVVIDEVGKVLAFNRAAERIFGVPAREIIGQRVERLMPEPHRSNHERYMRRYLDSGEARIIGIGREVEGVRANGEVFPIMLSVGEARSGDRRHFVATIRDLTGQRESAQQMRELQSRLAQVDRFNLMGEMAAGIAHEINQPLSAIATYAQAARRVLKREPLDGGALGDICEKIDNQARRAGQVIENVRRFVRRQEDHSEIIDVNRLVLDVRELIVADAKTATVEVKFRLADHLPPVVADAVQLQQVLLNLTRNAVDAMRAGSGAHPEIVVETMLTDTNQVRVAVLDQGPGVEAAVGERIFDAFVTTKAAGLGVGLAISRSIIQAFNGTLAFRNRTSGGAEFAFELPAADMTEDNNGKRGTAGLRHR